MRDEGGDAPLLKLGGAAGQRAVEAHAGNGDVIALEVHDGLDVVLGEVGSVVRNELLGLEGLGDGRRNLDLDQGLAGSVDGGPVLLDDLLTLLDEGLLGILLDQVDGLILRQDTADLEEGGLHDSVDPRSKTSLLGDGQSVDVVEADLPVDDDLLVMAGQVLEDDVGRNGAVEQEDSALLQVVEHRIAADVCRIVAGHEVGMVDEPGHVEVALAEAQVADRDAAGLLRVVGEVGLGVLVGVVADDLDRVLVGADGTIGTETVEHAADDSLRSDVDDVVDGNRLVGDVIVDADGEAVEGVLAGKEVEDGLGVAGSEVLGGKSIAATDDLDGIPALVLEGCDDIEEEGLSEASGLLGPVHDGDPLDGSRDGVDEGAGAEGAVEADLQDTDLGAVLVHVLDGPVEGVGCGAHDDDDIGGVGSADIVEEVILAAGEGCDLVHVLLDDAGNGVIVLVRGLAALEVDVLVLAGDMDLGMLRLLGAGAEAGDELLVDQAPDVVIADLLDLLVLVAGPEAVEEVEEGHLGLECGQMGDEGHVHGLLDGGGAGHREAGLAAGHDIAVVTEDRQRLGGDGAGRDMEDAGEHLTGDLEHVRNHQKQSLRSREGRGQGACDE